MQPRKVQRADRGGAVFDAEYPEDLPDIDAAQMLADLKAGKIIKGEGKGAAAEENAAEVYPGAEELRDFDAARVLAEGDGALSGDLPFEIVIAFRSGLPELRALRFK